MPAGENSKAYAITLVDPNDLSISATFTQLTASTPSLALATTSATAGSVTTVNVDQSNLNSALASQVYLYNVLDEENAEEISSPTVTGTYVQFSHTFNAGKYAVKVWYDGYGWGSVTGNI